jgi:hypothetical protein
LRALRRIKLYPNGRRVLAKIHPRSSDAQCCSEAVRVAGTLAHGTTAERNLGNSRSSCMVRSQALDCVQQPRLIQSTRLFLLLWRSCGGGGCFDMWSRGSLTCGVAMMQVPVSSLQHVQLPICGAQPYWNGDLQKHVCGLHFSKACDLLCSVRYQTSSSVSHDPHL